MSGVVGLFKVIGTLINKNFLKSKFISEFYYVENFPEGGEDYNLDADSKKTNLMENQN